MSVPLSSSDESSKMIRPKFSIFKEYPPLLSLSLSSSATATSATSTQPQHSALTNVEAATSTKTSNEIRTTTTTTTTPTCLLTSLRNAIATTNTDDALSPCESETSCSWFDSVLNTNIKNIGQQQQKQLSADFHHQQQQQYHRLYNYCHHMLSLNHQNSINCQQQNQRQKELGHGQQKLLAQHQRGGSPSPRQPYKAQKFLQLLTYFMAIIAVLSMTHVNANEHMSLMTGDLETMTTTTTRTTTTNPTAGVVITSTRSTTTTATSPPDSFTTPATLEFVSKSNISAEFSLQHSLNISITANDNGIRPNAASSFASLPPALFSTTTTTTGAAASSMQMPNSSLPTSGTLPKSDVIDTKGNKAASLVAKVIPSRFVRSLDNGGESNSGSGGGSSSFNPSASGSSGLMNIFNQNLDVGLGNIIECPSFDENSACPCYKFEDGLFLECPGTTAISLRSTLERISSPIHSLSIYDFDRSVTSLSQDVFQPGVNIRHLQFSHSHLETLKDNSLKNVRASLESLSIVNGKLTQEYNLRPSTDAKRGKICVCELN